MEYKYAVALLKRGEEQILGIFDTKEKAEEAAAELKKSYTCVHLAHPVKR